MIVAAPPGLPGARRGVIDPTLVSLLDIFPTFADIAGVSQSKIDIKSHFPQVST
jgi:arylsulfatase A-like enzyme